MDQFDITRIGMAHHRKLRKTIPNPSAEAQEIWRMQDARWEALLSLYEGYAAEEADEIIITSEVD